MSSSEQSLVTVNFSSRWFFMPPFAAILTVIAVRFFSSDVIIPLDHAIWGLSGLMFTLLTVLYGIFIKRNFTKGLFPAQIAAQGFLLCPLALRFGTRWLSWVGVLLAICGAVVLAALYYFRSGSAAAFPILRGESGPDADSLPVPFVITDSEGGIISVSSLLLRLAQKNRAAVSGAKIDALFPLDKEMVVMGGKSWRVLQTPMEDGTYYFQLEEAREPASPVRETEGGGVFDAATSLYSLPYATRRIAEELYRIYRYKRWMSAALLRLIFIAGDASAPGQSKEAEIFNDYCRFVGANTRETDISCSSPPRESGDAYEILVVMPETELDGARDVVSKLLEFSAQVQEKIRGYDGTVKVMERTAFFNASSGVQDFDGLMEKLYEAMNS